MDSSSLAAVIEIVWLDLLLSGDNAVLLALATRALPQEQRRSGVLLGTVLFIGLRIAVLFALLTCAPLPGFGFLGALLLLWAAVSLALRKDAPASQPRRSLFAALAACLMLDAPGALQNMTAVVGAANGARPLALFGLALSIPLIALGSAQFITALRKPPLLWAGVGLLGWLAGKLAAGDALTLASPVPPTLAQDFAPPVGLLLALLLAFGFSRGRPQKGVPQE